MKFFIHNEVTYWRINEETENWNQQHPYIKKEWPTKGFYNMEFTLTYGMWELH